LGSYTSSIFTLDFIPPTTVEAADGKIVQGVNLTAGLNPSWVFRHPSLKDIVYAVQENTNGSVIVGRLSEGGKKLDVLGEISTGGGFPFVFPSLLSSPPSSFTADLSSPFFLI